MAGGRVQRNRFRLPPRSSRENRYLSPELGTSPELEILFHNDQRQPVLQFLREVHIALDTGTERTKASFLLRYDNKTNSGPPADAPTTVQWQNYESSVPSQVAFKDEGRMIWGDEVEQELRTEGIKQSQVIRHLKASLFDAQIHSQRPPQPELSRSLPKMRKIELMNSLQSCGEDADDYQLENLSLYSDYMGHVYRYVLYFIAKTHGSLGWPVRDNRDLYKAWNPPGNVQIRVALPLPVGSTPRQVQLVVAAAKSAGIPNPYPVAEPASALIHHLFKSRADGQSIIGKRYLISDVGAGSADHQVWEVVEQQPLQLREIGIPEEAKTAWCGGAFVNQIATQQIMRDIRDIDRVLRATQRSNGPSDRQSLELKIAKKFEKEKLRFEGRETIYLRIKGLPDIPEFRLRGGNKVILQPEDVKNAFAPCLGRIVLMLDTAIKSLERQTSRGTVQGIDEIIVVGGVSQNRYFLDQIRNRYSGGLRSLFRYTIPVTLPPEAASGSLTVAHGAVLLSAERDLIKERYIRRSFCVGRHEEVDRRMYPAESWYTSPQDGQVRVNVTRFLFRQGFHPQRFSSAPFQGWRGLIPDDMEDGSWLIQEQLYYSDTLSQDGLWIEDPTIDVHAMPAPLSFRISSEEARLFPRERGPSNVEWFYLEYELILSLDGHIMTFNFTIPKKGRFPKRGDRYANVMRKTGRYDTAGVSKLFNSA